MVVRISDATSNLDASWQRLERVLLSIENRQGTNLNFEDFNRLRLGVNDLSRNINSTQRQLRFVRPFISLNDEWKISVELLDISQQLAFSTQDILQGIEPTVNFLEQGGDNNALASQISSGERLVELLEIGQSNFSQASLSLKDADTMLKSVNLSEASIDLVLSFQQIQSLHQQLTTINSVLISSPDILSQFMGLDSEVTYLILAQNNDEIRPSGGYISAYGWFKVRNGRVTDFDYSASTATSPIPPSESFLDTFQSPEWWIEYENPIYTAWSGSWNVDFPSTAHLAMDYYNSGRNINAPVNGVIAMDLHSLEQILNVLVEVVVSDFDKTLTLANFRQGVYDFQAFGNQEHGRYLAAIHSAIFEKLQNVQQSRSADLISVVIEALSQRHIMIYLPDEDSQAIITQLGWSGAQAAASEHDYILVADANLTNKSNHSVIRSLSYDVEILQDQSRLSNLRVRYDYFDSVASQDPAVNSEYYGSENYRALTQIFIPDNITNLQEDNLSQSSVNHSNGYTLVVSRVDVDYDTSKQMQISYETPASIDRVGDLYRYRALIQKQPGSQIQDLSIQITLPENATIISLSPDATASYALDQPILDFRLQLITDQWIEVLYSLD